MPTYKDALAKNGSYTDSSGNTKARYVKAGTFVFNDDGSVYVILEPTFNPAGIERSSGSTGVFISPFDRDKSKQPAPQSAARPQPAPANTAMDDEPF